MKIKLIVATCKNNGIGFQNSIPWYFKKDLRYFSKVTKGLENEKNSILMGRKTWESLPKQPLPGRLNIVLSYTLNNQYSVDSIDKAIKRCKENEIDTLWIIGGGTLYESFLRDPELIKMYPVHEIHHTEIQQSYCCDRFLIPIWKKEPHIWHLSSTHFLEENGVELYFRVYKNENIVTSLINI
jgi:dihydrofolate reductase